MKDGKLFRAMMKSSIGFNYCFIRVVDHEKTARCRITVSDV